MTEKCHYRTDDFAEMERHLSECDVCREKETAFERIEETLVERDREHDLAERIVSSLPVAPWEGARHRSWGVVGIVALIIGLATFVTSWLSDLSTTTAVSAGMETIPTLGVMTSVADALGRLTGSADTGFHVAVIAGFVLFNTLLILLLRRRPRGFDV